jgi:uncharacterized protein with GYD domain
LRELAYGGMMVALREEAAMPLYLIQLKQSPETFKRLVKDPEDRRPAATALIEAVGGKLQGYWYAFGEYDVLVLAELPDNVTAAALISKIAASGAWSGGQTTVLLTVDEMVEAYRRAGDLEYKPPGG